MFFKLLSFFIFPNSSIQLPCNELTIKFDKNLDLFASVICNQQPT